MKTDHSLRAVLAAVIGNSLVTAAKFVAWALTFSPSLLAESIHSLADTLNQVLLFVGIRHGEGKPTAAYPFGKGRARYIWNLVSAMGIFFVGFGFIPVRIVKVRWLKRFSYAGTRLLIQFLSFVWRRGVPRR